MTAEIIPTGDPVLPGVKDGKTATKASTSSKAAPRPAKAVKADKAEKASRDKLATQDSAADKSSAESKAKRHESLDRAKKDKLVRDSFTMPATEYALISQLKKRCLAKGVAAKKSEILRAAVASLSAASDATVLKAIKRLDIIKTGRPSKGKSGAGV